MATISKFLWAGFGLGVATVGLKSLDRVFYYYDERRPETLKEETLRLRVLEEQKKYAAA